MMPGPGGNGNGNGQGGGGNGGSGSSAGSYGTNASCDQIQNFIDLVNQYASENYTDLPGSVRGQIVGFSNAHSGLFRDGAVPNGGIFNQTQQNMWWLDVVDDINGGANSDAFKADDPSDAYDC